MDLHLKFFDGTTYRGRGAGGLVDNMRLRSTFTETLDRSQYMKEFAKRVKAMYKRNVRTFSPWLFLFDIAQLSIVDSFAWTITFKSKKEKDNDS